MLQSNQLHLVVLRGDGSTIVNDSFKGTTPGARPGGLCFSGQNVMVGTNRFSDMPLGVLLFGNDPEYGTYLGVASCQAAVFVPDVWGLKSPVWS